MRAAFIALPSNNMKRTALFTMLFSVGFLFGQTPTCTSAETPKNPTLKLQGRVIGIKLLNEDQHQIRFGLQLTLKFVNEGNERFILLKQSFDIVAEMLAANCEAGKEGAYLYVSTHGSSVSLAPEWTRWRQHLDTQSPSNLLSVLAPGESLSFDANTTINIEKNGSFDRRNKSWDEIRRSPTVCLLVEVQTWPTNLEPKHNPETPEFGEALRSRWRSFGELQLSPLTSEPMKLAFP